MRRKDFALSWGRKMFFGMGWALTSLVALNYFRSMIIPQTFGGWFYYLMTYVGHYGVIISILYFLFYCPVISIFPTYYISKIWSAILLIVANILIFFDGHLFIKYRYHLNSFLFQLLKEGSGKDVLGLSKSGVILFCFVVLVTFFVLWIRGEWLWRAMQARFSNPVKNWYLVVIMTCFIGSHLYHMYGDAKGAKNITKISALFPLNFPLTSKGFLNSKGIISHVSSGHQGFRDFYYPASPMECGKAPDFNIVFLTLDSWPAENLNGIETPEMWHIANHGLLFTNHFSGGNNGQEGLFSLFYSLPPSYLSSAMAEDKESVLSRVLTKSDYKVLNVSFSARTSLERFLPGMTAETMGDLDNFITDRASDSAFFTLNVLFGAGLSLSEKDQMVKRIMDVLYTKKLISQTIVILTGTHGRGDANVKGMTLGELKTPLLVIWPGIKAGVNESYTSHYDVVPTILREEFKCKNNISDYSFGRSLFSKEQRSVHVAGSYRELSILDFDVNSFTTIDPYRGMDVRDFDLKPYPREKVDETKVLNVLERLTYFFRRH